MSTTFRITSTSTSPARVEVFARQHSFTVDEPASLGGTDVGANPVEYLLGALTGCFNVVIHLVAKEHDVEIEALTLEAEGDIDPSFFLGTSSEGRAGFTGIRIRVGLTADADAETIDRIIAESKRRCPVSDNLANLTPVEFELAAEDALVEAA